MKERLYIGEATVASIAGLILGPHCLNWFDPFSWGNSDKITLEICRIVLCIQIVAVAVELPKKYMLRHWLSVAIFLLPVMTSGWLIVGLFIWALIPHFDYSAALLVSACVTATDPVLAAAVVGKSKFAQRVPGHLRNLLSAESGCNDGMAFPFIYLSLNLVIYPGKAGQIVKDWICITILYECVFGCVLGTIVGLVLRYAVSFAEKKNLIDRESFLAIFVFIAFNCAGIGSILGVDDLLMSFAAGTAFGWNGYFARKTEESHVSTVIDLVLNLAFFVYFGAVIPWPDFNNSRIGLDVWRLIIVAIVIIFLRRLPAVVSLKPITPDVKTWREAFFCGHFGPIGVGALFACILARTDLEKHYTSDEVPLEEVPHIPFPHAQLLEVMWPVVCFIVITSILIHGSSVAVFALGKKLNTMAITMTLTTTNTQEQGSSWLSRLSKLDKTSTSFSLHRVDTQAKSTSAPESPNGVETSGIKVRPAGGAKRKKHKKKKHPVSKLRYSLSNASPEEEEPIKRQRPQTEFLQLGKPAPDSNSLSDEEGEKDISQKLESTTPENENAKEYASAKDVTDSEKQEEQNVGPETTREPERENDSLVAYEEGRLIILEDTSGEHATVLKEDDKPDKDSVHSWNSLERKASQYSETDEASDHTPEQPKVAKEKEPRTKKKRSYRKKGDIDSRKVYVHQVDEFILIENEDGEVIRRYKINKHSAPFQKKQKNPVSKALSFVGINKNQPPVGDTEGTSEISTQDKDANPVLIPETDNKKVKKNPFRDQRMEEKVENKLVDLLSKTKGQKMEGGTGGTGIVDPPAMSRNEAAENIEEDSEVENSEEETDEEENNEDNISETKGSPNESLRDEILNENEVEKRRRLAALGQMPTQRNEEDEEE